MKNKVDSVHFQNFSWFYFSFSWQIIHLKNVDVCTFWRGMCTFWRGSGFEKVYVLYTHLNVDNYERPFTDQPINIKKASGFPASEKFYWMWVELCRSPAVNTDLFFWMVHLHLLLCHGYLSLSCDFDTFP